MIYADYTVPIDSLRAELRRICESTPLWNGEVCVLQVTDANERAVQLRALVDARNSQDAWDLRCMIREKLVEYLQKNYPQSLPLYRAQFEAISEQSQSANSANSGGHEIRLSTS
jgi:hypothetical protein